MLANERTFMQTVDNHIVLCIVHMMQHIILRETHAYGRRLKSDYNFI